MEIFHFNIRQYISGLFCSFVILLSTHLCVAQNKFQSIHSVHDHSAAEWLIFGIDSMEYEWESQLYLKWPLRNDWNHWTVEFKNSYITIKNRWNLNPAHWELSSDHINLSIRQKWRNDLSEWDIICDGQRLTWKTIYSNRLDEWYFEAEGQGSFDMWTRYQGDPRDWDIDDQAPTIADEIKIAAMFITVYLANPNR